MKQGFHPNYNLSAQVICQSCGRTWTTGSTLKVIRTDVCSNCHPFYTGQQRIVDTEGQVDRFYKKLQARQQFISEKEARETARTSPDRLVADIELGTRLTETLSKAGITKVGQIIEKLTEGESTLLAIDGFGRKALADVKKRLRQLGYELPQSEEVAA